MIHPFLRGVEPGEPFDPLAYAVELGKALYRKEQEQQAALRASAVRASKLLGDNYGLGHTRILRPIFIPGPRSRKRNGMTDAILTLLREKGPMTAGQVRLELGYYQVIPLLHGLKRQRRVVAEGLRSSRSILWKVLT